MTEFTWLLSVVGFVFVACVLVALLLNGIDWAQRKWGGNTEVTYPDRDDLAESAMVGLLSAPLGVRDGQILRETPENIAAAAYSFADAMLAERERRAS